jgi:hypothetical protein
VVKRSGADGEEAFSVRFRGLCKELTTIVLASCADVQALQRPKISEEIASRANYFAASSVRPVASHTENETSRPSGGLHGIFQVSGTLVWPLRVPCPARLQ